MEWTVYEIIDNIRLHSDTPVLGVLTAQYYPRRHRLDIAIVDAGRGIMSSLSEISTYGVMAMRSPKPFSAV